MYFTKAFAASDISDVDVIAHEDRLHLFYHSLPNCDLVAHLVSDDGVNWEQLPYVLRVGDPGEFDDDQIWTMHVCRWRDRFYMLYTALKQSENGLIQRAGLAVSDDLMRWEKVENNPIAEADPRWYEADTSDSGRADWRDPFGWVEGDKIHAVICAHEKDGPQNRRGCVGYFTSEDGVNWQVQPPLYTPHLSSDYEVPTIIKLGERYYLLGHIVAPSIDVYRVADSLEGPWRRPANDWLLPPANHAFCPVVWRGRTLLYNWILADFDWPNERRIVGYAENTRAIAPPKEAGALDDGQLALRSCDFIWDGLALSRSTPAFTETLEGTFRGEWKIGGEQLFANCDPGMGVALWPEEYSDFRFTVAVTLEDACEIGIVWRSDETADQATRVALLPGRQRIELQRVVLHPLSEPKRIGRGFSVLQENYCEIRAGEPLRLQVIAYGPYIEVSVNDRVLLCHLTMSRRAGQIGLFATDGKASFQNPDLAILPPPTSMPS
jgi:beta-fructofuranosidase